MQNRDDEMLDLYLSESEQNLQTLDDLLLAAQSATSLRRQDIAEVFRLIHTLKGASAMMQYHALEESAHLLEDILAALRGTDSVPPQSGNSDILSACFQFTDYFSEQLERIKHGKDAVSSAELNSALKRVARSLHIQPAPAAEAPFTPSTPVSQAPPGSTRLHLRLRKCPMPHIRSNVIMKSVLSLCDGVLSVPRDIELHPELGEHILESGLEIYVIPKSGVDLAQITDKLSKQPFVVSVNAPNPKETAPSVRQRENTIHIPQSKLNNLVAVLDELVTTQSMLADVLESAALSDSRAAYLMGRLRHDAAQARDLSAEMGMVEIGAVFQQMRRLVRVMAQECGRSISFVSEGDSVPVDGNMVEMISDALVHLVRNAVDHGIEPPDSRIRDKKKAEGTISLSAKKENGLLVLSVADDGRGIDREAVLKKAFEKGLIPQRRQRCSDNELLEILASTGFSTKTDVSKYSGRGVGLDTAVRRVRDMQGGISLESVAGQGSRFILRIPTTLSLLSVLTLRMGETRVLLPCADVASVCFAKRAAKRNKKVLFRAQEYDRLPMPAAFCENDDDVFVFLASEYGQHYIRAARADIVGELLLLPLPQYVSDMLGKENIFGGCCIDKDGAILCVIDIHKLMAAKDIWLEGGNHNEDI